MGPLTTDLMNVMRRKYPDVTITTQKQQLSSGDITHRGEVCVRDLNAASSQMTNAMQLFTLLGMGKGGKATGRGGFKRSRNRQKVQEEEKEQLPVL